MALTLGLLCLALCLALPSTVLGAPQQAQQGSDFFSVTAKQVAEALRKEMMDSLATGSGHSKRAQQEENGENLVQPELHFSTLRAEASGSGIPSPTMFVGGFSFMMMPTPEGEQIFNRIMESLPNLGPNKPSK